MTKLTKAELASVVKWLHGKVVDAIDANDVDDLRLRQSLLLEAHKELANAMTRDSPDIGFDVFCGQVNEHRARRLRAAIDQYAKGNVSAFGRLIGYSDGAFVRQMLSGARPITEKTVIAIEGELGCRGWFAAQSGNQDSKEAA